MRDRIPVAWVVRDIEPDYGVDQAVEVFDEQGLATGRSFLVQLKATDEADLRRALAVRLRTSTANYFRALEQPVLIGRLHAPSGRLFVKWFHEHDPHYGARRDQTSETFTFRLAESDEWTDSTPDELAATAEAFRRLRRPELPQPVRFFVRGESEQIHGQSLAEHLIALRRVANDVGSIVSFRLGEASAGEFSISMGAESTRIDLSGISSVTLHHDTEDFAAEAIASDIVIGVALALDEVGQPNLAAQVATAALSSASLIGDPEVMFRIAAALARSRRISEALRLADELDQRAEAGPIAATVLMTAALAQGELRPEVADQLRVTQRNRIERRLANRDVHGAATEHYNLANHLRTHRQGREAFRHYRHAARLWPDYLDRDYFCAELGGVLFETGHYGLSAHYYGRASELGAPPETRALHADALLWQGRYGEAHAALEQALEEIPEAAAEWRLKAIVIPTIIERVGEVQERRAPEAEALTRFTGDVSLEKGESRLHDAIAADGLCYPAWMYLGVLAAGAEGLRSAEQPLLLAALIARNDAVAWANAVVAAFSGDREHLPLILEAGAYLANDEFEGLVVAHAQQHLEREDGELLLRLLEDAVSVVDERERTMGFQLRLPDEQGVYRSFEIRPETV
jgi:tetratricopeptide (TPR) repeat protein